ncbi:unnamed protein product [Cochlearia groenlandica]
MSEEGPKLYTNKPKKKGYLFYTKQSSSSSSSSSHSAAASYTTGGSVPPPPPLKESFARRYKYVWPVLLTVNLAIGGYLFFRTKKKDIDTSDEETVAKSGGLVAAAAPVGMSKPVSSSAAVVAVAEPVMVVKAREPIPEKQQRELFKWMLEEKRKVKTRNAEEKKINDEEKAILKHFIASKTIPTL